MNFEFSYIGLIFLVMLFAPNIIWAKNKPKDYDKYVKNENRLLSILESLGQVLVVCFSLFVIDFDIIDSSWQIMLILVFLFMIMYELYWVRYFKSSKTMADMYSGFLGIPVAGATLPVIAFFLLGIYQKNIFLMLSTLILGVGHIGIHLAHEKELS